ncbi:hypothetical protein CDAR_478371 [Caerostris darwini]|uniref:Uncharacterized protein n=1 Tax=Caerostris darwini TaxID=1538125 RepID=A0AAV4MUM9_9ARAC|nr:hypothetical protein CDAR_478371 [Caerostris darwini]
MRSLHSPVISARFNAYIELICFPGVRSITSDIKSRRRRGKHERKHVIPMFAQTRTPRCDRKWFMYHQEALMLLNHHSRDNSIVCVQAIHRDVQYIRIMMDLIYNTL